MVDKQVIGRQLVERQVIDSQMEENCRTCHGFQLVEQFTPSEPLRRSTWKELAFDLI